MLADEGEQSLPPQNMSFREIILSWLFYTSLSLPPLHLVPSLSCLKELRSNNLLKWSITVGVAGRQESSNLIVGLSWILGAQKAQ